MFVEHGRKQESPRILIRGLCFQQRTRGLTPRQVLQGIRPPERCPLHLIGLLKRDFCGVTVGEASTDRAPVAIEEKTLVKLAVHRDRPASEIRRWRRGCRGGAVDHVLILNPDRIKKNWDLSGWPHL